jgi:hypothetical protein
MTVFLISVFFYRNSSLMSDITLSNSRSILVGLKKKISTAKEFAHELDSPKEDVLEVSAKEGE